MRAGDAAVAQDGREITQQNEVVFSPSEVAEELSLMQEQAAKDIDVSKIVFDDQTKTMLRQ